MNLIHEVKKTGLVESTRELWNGAKRVMAQVAYNLVEIRDSGEWMSYGHDTFPKFCDYELDIKQSQTSKLLTIAEYYRDKFTPDQLGDTDYERLYASTKIEGTPEENLSRAKTWTRDDFKQDKAESQPHEFERVCYCRVCGLSEERHP